MAKLEVNVKGHTKRLFFYPEISQCGDVKDGVAFHFEGEGTWVVDYQELRDLVEASIQPLHDTVKTLFYKEQSTIHISPMYVYQPRGSSRPRFPRGLAETVTCLGPVTRPVWLQDLPHPVATPLPV